MAFRKIEMIGPVGHALRVRLRSERKQKKWTLAEAARAMAKIGRPLSLNMISEIENGGRRVDVDDLAAFSIIYNRSMDFLLRMET